MPLLSQHNTAHESFYHGSEVWNYSSTTPVIRRIGVAYHMVKWECQVCGWVYDEDVGDPDSGIAPGTKFEDIPDDWVCPMCGASKEDFECID